MKTSVDRAIGKTEELLTAEARRHGEGTDWVGRLKSAWGIVHAVIDEIFDESAYDRFLQRTQVPHSVEAYRAFQRERESAVSRKPRCC